MSDLSIEDVWQELLNFELTTPMVRVVRDDEWNPHVAVPQTNNDGNGQIVALCDSSIMLESPDLREMGETPAATYLSPRNPEPTCNKCRSLLAEGLVEELNFR